LTYILIIPVFNEEQNIKNLINSLSKSFLIDDDSCVNILLINDGSNDNSEYLIRTELKNNKKIILLNHEKNIGYGGAIKTGINYSKNLSKYVVFADSDLTNPIDDIKKITNFMKQDVDFIQANRYKNNTDDIQVHRKLIGILGNFLCRFFMNMKIDDYTNGFRAVKSRLYNNIDLRENDFSIIMEEKYKLKNFIYTIAEFSTILGKRGNNLNKSSFEYSIKLIMKYLYYCVLTVLKINKSLKKID
jgi:dolichol-phosphate mannosyltransferase